MINEKLNWKLHQSKYVFKDRWFIARADRCEMPNGKIVEPYYVLEFPNWCNVVVITEHDEVLMVKQYRHAIQSTTIELPGGVIDAHETPEQAAIREVKEETGYSINTLKLLYKTAPNPATNNNYAFMFLATGAKKNHVQALDAYEDIEIDTYTKNEIITLLTEGKILHGVQIGALYAAMYALGWLKNN